MKTISSLFLAFLFICNLTAQNKLDSLEFYNQNSTDTIRLNKLINYCFTHIEEIPDEAFLYSQKAIFKSKELNSFSCEARANTNLGAIEALRGNYSQALKYYLESLALWEKLKGYRGILLSKNNIAQVYGYLKKTDLEYQFLKEAETIAQQYAFTDELGLIKTNLAIFYTNTGDFRRAFKEQSEAILIYRKVNNFSQISIGYSNAGAILFYLNKIDSAILYYQKSKDLGEKMNNKKAIALSFANLAEAFQKKGNIDTATQYYLKAIEISKSIGLKDILLFSYDQLTSIYKSNKNYDKAFEYINLKQVIKDSIFNSNASKQLAELQTKYNTDKKNHTIIEQDLQIKNQQYWLIVTIISFIFLLLLIFSIIRWSKLKQEAKNLQSMRVKDDLATKAILAAEENERKRIALELHDGVGQMISVAKMNLSAISHDFDFLNNDQKLQFDKAISLVDQSCAEVRNVSHLMMPIASLKSGLSFAVKSFLDKINNNNLSINLYTSGIDQSIDINIETVVYRVLQEAVTNVVKHAKATQLDISIVFENNFLSATIEDNGIGFNLEDIAEKDGIGLQNIKTRINFLQGTVEWDSIKGKGTVIVINIPFEKLVIT
ncbi:MAG: sensor histidine kinase [Sediminibacterium sp.]|nr:sensor histidine kinase [Sediminibacterium sp.]